MKRIEAIIRPARLDAVKAALNEVGVQGMTVSEVRGFGRTGGKTEVFRGSAYAVDFVPKIRIVVVVADSVLTTTTDVIVKAASTGKIGDGKIFVTDVFDAIRIRTNEHGDSGLI